MQQTGVRVTPRQTSTRNRVSCIATDFHKPKRLNRHLHAWTYIHVHRCKTSWYASDAKAVEPFVMLHVYLDCSAISLLLPTLHRVVRPYRSRHHKSTTWTLFPSFPVLPCVNAAFTINPPLFEPGPCMSHFHKTLLRPCQTTPTASIQPGFGSMS